MVGKQRERELRRAAARVTPLEAGGAVIPQVKTGIERKSVDGDYGIMAVAFSFIKLRDFSSAALPCNGGRGGGFGGEQKKTPSKVVALGVQKTGKTGAPAATRL